MKLLSISLMTAVAVAVAGSVSPAAAGPSAEKNIVQTAQASGQFKTLTALVKKAGLAQTLAKPGPYTVFAPTDAAFRKVPKRTLTALANDRRKLRAVLLYHVVPGEVTSSEVVTLRSARTLNGKAVRVRATGGSVFINNAKVTTPDVMASNGVIHVVNRVLIPPTR
jgi:uncharacterized surface protein with fasciclin (FAS1) repeats